jgi:peptidyl-prolyl cis-trans isomerase D
MLEAIRTAAQTWIAKVILALISIPFALWGVESYIRTSPGTNTIATAGGDKISSQEFDNAMKAQLDQLRQRFGDG